ncbi:molybdate ABC transporter permease subunit [Azomonas macrocytogenes]|uniref:Molybdenum transport system permease n=1 Tax=Azomonas macrocytogenes TaxID=69962 RepID=A0A839T517_AZOMA|nr:molybdate ABC transporter permease subunit [Azomonas macrocytogenes]MBB3103404.1 molybdate transport system permease protein [Azomonas macrocytogenes]
MNDIATVLTEPHVIHALSLTARVALTTLGIHLILGLLLGYALSRPRWFGRELVDLLVTLPLMFPPVATGFLLLMLLGRRGPVGGWLGTYWNTEVVFSFSGVLIASVVAGLPLVVKPVQSALENVSGRLAEAARVLGKNEWQIFLRVLLPNIRRILITGLLLALGRSLGEVGITLMIGGNVSGRTSTISLEIYNSVSSGEFERAAVLSFLLGLVSLGLFALLRYLGRARPVLENPI